MTHYSGYWRGVLMTVTTAVLWGATGPVAKLIANQGLSQLSVLAYRAVVITLLVGVWLRIRKGENFYRVPKKLLYIYALLGFLTLICMAGGYMISCIYLTIPQAVILHYTFPLLTIAGDVVWLRERPTGAQILAAFLILAGLYVGFVMESGGIGTISMIGVAWGTLSVVGFAVQNLVTRSIVRNGKSDPLVQMFYVHIFGGILIIAGKSIFSGWGDLAVLTPKLFALIQYPTFFAGLLGFTLLFTAMKYIPATMSSLICALEIVGAIVIAIPLLNAMPTAHEIAGSVIILFAVAISTMKRKNVGRAVTPP